MHARQEITHSISDCKRASLADFYHGPGRVEPKSNWILRDAVSKVGDICVERDH